MLGFSRILELLLIEVEPVELRLTEMSDEDLLAIEEPGCLEIVIWLEVDPPGLLLEDIVPDRVGLVLLIEILLDLLRLGTILLDEIEPERLGANRITEVLLELLRLGAGRLDDIEPERLGVDRLTDILLELLRLGTDLLTDGRLGTDRLVLRLADIELERLGVGARLTVGLLREGVGARVGAAGLAACVVWLELPELVLFRELLATSVESAAKAKRKIKRTNRKL